MTRGFEDIGNVVAVATGRRPTSTDGPRFAHDSAHAEDEFQPRILSRCMADVEPEPVVWLWPDRVPCGKLTLIVGDPGLGKSFVTVDMAARLSRGTPWPDRPTEPVAPDATIILSAEDDVADTIRPRLDAASADTRRVFIIDGVQRAPDGRACYFTFDADLRSLERCIVDNSARLVIVDPISAYLGATDSHSNADIRGLLGPLADMAARCGCAVVAVTHMNKSAMGKAIYRAMGSLAFTAAARIAWLVAKDPEDPRRRLVLPLKSNLIQEPTGISFQLEDGRVHWHAEPVTLDADSALHIDGRDQRERVEAAEWLTAQLVLGPMPAIDIKAAAEAEGIAWRTLQRAKKSIGVLSRREGFGAIGGFVWEMPADAMRDAS